MSFEYKSISEKNNIATKEIQSIIGGFLFIISATVGGAWLTSAIYCLTTDRYSLLILDILFLPLGVLHGLVLWVDGLIKLI